MSKFVSLHQHSCGDSLLDSCAKPKDMAERCASLEMGALAITGHGSISSAIDIHQAATKKGLKPLLGVELYLSQQHETIQAPENKYHSHLPIISKNLKGWKQLLKIIAHTNRPENYYYKPRLSLESLAQYLDGNILGFSGHLGSDLSNVLFQDENDQLDPDWRDKAGRLAQYYQDIFGRGNFWIEIQTLDHLNNPIVKQVAQCLRQVSRDTGIPCVATGDAHYVNPEDAELQQIVLSNSIKKSIPELKGNLSQGQDIPFKAFYTGKGKFFIPSYDDLKDCNTPEEIENTCVIADSCESYDITNKPFMPKFDCPNGLSENEYLLKLCEDGLREKNLNESKYRDRISQEFGVLSSVGLSSYFLVVRDYVDWAKNQGILVGPGRGSAGGCLVSYLIGITKIDPMKYNLFFERFYNSGRNTPDRIAMPDIDIDFEVGRRDKVIEYIKNKYGHKKVSAISTFGRMMGKGALSDVLRAYGVDFTLAKEITKHFPNESNIADEIQDVENHSIIRWVLQNQPEKVAQYCECDNEGVPKCEGDLGIYFNMAMRLEGCFRSQGRHASGIVICNDDLETICPMVYDSRHKEQICGFDLKSAESAGLVKVDILGVAALDKLNKAMRLINMNV